MGIRIPIDQGLTVILPKAGREDLMIGLGYRREITAEFHLIVGQPQARARQGFHRRELHGGVTPLFIGHM